MPSNNDFPTDLGEMDATQLRGLFESGEASPVDAAIASLARIEKFNPAVNAFSHVAHEMALEMALQSEERWRLKAPLSPIDGIPSTIKELTPVIGICTRKGSALGDLEPSRTEPEAVKRLRLAGVTILGTTASPEFGWKGVTHGPAIGSTANPWNTTRTSGGSSGGAGVAAALNMGVLHEGSDGAGSIRIPASFCGVFGIKPTYGWVPLAAITPHFELAHRGPLARNVMDATLFLEAISGYSPDSAFAYCPDRVPSWSRELNRDVTGLKIGYSRTLGFAGVDRDVADALDSAARKLEEMGCIVEEAKPGFEIPHRDLCTLWSAALADVVDSMSLSVSQKALMDPGLINLVESASSLTVRDYVAARLTVGRLKAAMGRFHENYDLLLTPTMPITAFAVGHDVPPGSAMSDWTEWSPFTYPFNMTGQPTASVPCGFDRIGLPIGMQLIAPWFRDDLVLAVSHAFQKMDSQSWLSDVSEGESAAS